MASSEYVDVSPKQDEGMYVVTFKASRLEGGEYASVTFPGYNIDSKDGLFKFDIEDKEYNYVKGKIEVREQVEEFLISNGGYCVHPGLTPIYDINKSVVILDRLTYRETKKFDLIAVFSSLGEGRKGLSTIYKSLEEFIRFYKDFLKMTS